MKLITKKRGFTLVEMTLALALLGIILLALFKLTAFISDTLAECETRDALQATCVNLIEETRHTLAETKKLQCGSFVTQETAGAIEYILSYEIQELAYPGAYKLVISARTLTRQAFSEEVILYEAV